MNEAESRHYRPIYRRMRFGHGDVCNVASVNAASTHAAMSPKMGADESMGC